MKAFKTLAAKYPDWQVKIFGRADAVEKDFETYLQKIIREAHLEKQIYLCGTTKRIREQLQRADIFAFPSAYEGFGLAVAEAMAAGLPPVGFKNADAVRDLLQDGKTGILCADGVAAFAAGLEKLMQDAQLRARMGAQAREAMQAYQPRYVWDQWEDLLNNL